METEGNKAETPNPAAPGKLRIGSHLHVMRAGDVSSKVASECQNPWCRGTCQSISRSMIIPKGPRTQIIIGVQGPNAIILMVFGL